MINSFKYAGEGIKEMLTKHGNFRIQLAAALAVVVAGAVFRLSFGEWAMLMLTIGLVLGAEMANSSIEAVVDLITKERRLKAKIAKDVVAGMVLLVSMLSVAIGVLIFLPKILASLVLPG